MFIKCCFVNVIELIELCKGARSNQLSQINIANSQSEFPNVVLVIFS